MDTQHEKALFVLKQLQQDQPELVLSSLIFFEVITILSQRAGRRVAIEVGKLLRNSEHFTFIQSTTKLEQVSWEIFQAIPNKNVSFVDCSILAILKQEGIHSLLTFDEKDFAKFEKEYHFTVYPQI